MPGPLAPSIRSKIVRLLLMHERPEDIANGLYCGVSTVYEISQNIFIWGSPCKPCFRPRGAPFRIHRAAEKDLVSYLEEQPWVQQAEMAWFLWEEWGIMVHRSTVSRLLRRRKVNHKKGQRIGGDPRQSEELRSHWLAGMVDVLAEQLVYVDESMFNQMTGWRHRAYAPIGHPARYHADRTRGHSWSVLPAYTIDGK